MNYCAKTIENVAMNYFYYYKADFSYFLLILKTLPQNLFFKYKYEN